MDLDLTISESEDLDLPLWDLTTSLSMTDSFNTTFENYILLTL